MALDAFKKLEEKSADGLVEMKEYKQVLVDAKIPEEDAAKLIKELLNSGVFYEAKPGYLRRIQPCFSTHRNRTLLLRYIPSFLSVQESSLCSHLRAAKWWQAKMSGLDLKGFIQHLRF